MGARREHRLHAVDVAVLVVLLCEADYRTRRWEGTARALANGSGASTNTVPKALERLSSAGLVRQVAPFGHSDPGVVCICSYWRLIVPNDGTPREALLPCEHAQICATDEAERRADLREPSRSRRADLRDGRAVVAQNRATALAEQSDSGPREERVSEEGASEAGEPDARRLVVDEDGREWEIF
jgi:hypothetical protein